MRMISTDPEFSWSGTIFIVIGFTIFGLTQGIAVAARRATGRRWVINVGRLFGAIGTLPLFVAAGGIMMPTVVFGGLARHRTDWPRWVRGVFVVVASSSILFVGIQLHDEWAWAWQWWAGMAGLLAVYGCVIEFERGTMPPHADGWRLPRVVRVGAAVGAVGLVALTAVGAGFLR